MSPLQSNGLRSSSYLIWSEKTNANIQQFFYFRQGGLQKSGMCGPPGVRIGLFWIQIRKFLDLPDLDLLLFVQIRILYQQAKNLISTSKLNFIIGGWCECYYLLASWKSHWKNESRIRIRNPEVRIRGFGPTSNRYGSKTLKKYPLQYTKKRH